MRLAAKNLNMTGPRQFGSELLPSGSLCSNLNAHFKINQNYLKEFSSYRTVNTLRLGDKNQSVNIYGKIIAVCSEKHTNTLCGQNVEILNVKPCGIYSNYWVLTLLMTCWYVLRLFLRFPASVVDKS